MDIFVCVTAVFFFLYYHIIITENFKVVDIGYNRFGLYLVCLLVLDLRVIDLDSKSWIDLNLIMNLRYMINKNKKYGIFK